MFEGFLKNRRVQWGLGIFGAFVFVAVFGDLLIKLVGWGPLDVDYDALHTGPGHGGHLLGTTISGQDVLAQLISGARGSMAVGTLSALLAIALGAFIGVSSGFFGGTYDTVMNGITNVFMTMPSFALTLIAAGYISAAGGPGSNAMGWALMAFLIGIFEWPGMARYLRAQTLTLRSRDWAMATKLLGESRMRMIFSEVFPHLLGIVSATFLRAIMAGILAEAGLNFLGVSTGGVISWGTMITNAQNQGALTLGWWWWFLTPGLAIAFIGTAAALVNFGLDEVTNPKLRTGNAGAVNRFIKAQRRAARASA
ncbi:Putative peptide transport permease protein [Aestuariimicrobium sp. T2.26MG-19.2B]|uniref:ABC transporter permease n=1 Tax=Aestuariimicrobium sp. T2.26MG-19.2B TaxID=3040679 RepID=UPI0003B7096E|nr:MULTISPECIES: ABC transporter permease [Aestuariimicrobium]CAI9406742.1 Putative peptide transport permease protein [Aestuariimicrobium sp. T2.26MG-19.2B]